MIGLRGPLLHFSGVFGIGRQPLPEIIGDRHQPSPGGFGLGRDYMDEAAGQVDLAPIQPQKFAWSPRLDKLRSGSAI